MVSSMQHTTLQPISAPLIKTKNTYTKILSTSSNKPGSTGKIKRLVLTQEGRTKLNPYSDREFYRFPRLVKHVDDGFISTLTNLYREKLRPEMEILDIMSSWISHLPSDVKYKRVVGHGLNAQELAKNPRLDYFFVFAEVYRILKPGGVFIVSFSNRMFYEKAISAWRDGSGYSRVQLVVQYFQCVEGFTEPEVIRKLPATNFAQHNKSPIDWIMATFGFLSGLDPFYAVIAYRNFKPIE
ncbi:hypothetical protein PIB30_040030 [Stylosanthes scabra]|uniref:Methyltransferase type 11 domain-containing protein n=1 Tax=Stylosanthes scabra TaxID=79078 RepID=A0ABU6REW5_9FABA|nr:hypothetical protein [Stylosanthes scabra]